MLEDEIAEYIDTERRLDRLDRRLKMRKTVSILLISVLLCCLVIYAARIEHKISLLSQQSPVIIYMNAETSSNAEETTSSAEETSATDFADKATEETPTENTDVGHKTVNVAEKNEKIDDTTRPSVTLSESVLSEYYVTKTGSKYHRSGCSHLSKSKIPMSYDEIVAKGYKPCSKCIS